MGNLVGYSSLKPGTSVRFDGCTHDLEAIDREGYDQLNGRYATVVEVDELDPYLPYLLVFTDNPDGEDYYWVHDGDFTVIA